jgi:hypothetical protein
LHNLDAQIALVKHGISITDQAQELPGYFANLFIEYSIEFVWRVWIFSADVCKVPNALEKGRRMNSFEISFFF